MRDRLQTTFMRYAVALLAVTVAFTLTILIPWLHLRDSFILLLGAVSLAACYGGRGPALLSCVVVAILHDYFIFPPVFEFALGIDEIIPLSIFFLVAFMISSLTTGLATAEETAREQKQWLQVTLSSIGDA